MWWIYDGGDGDGYGDGDDGNDSEYGDGGYVGDDCDAGGDGGDVFWRYWWYGDSDVNDGNDDVDGDDDNFAAMINLLFRRNIQMMWWKSGKSCTRWSTLYLRR